MLYLVYIEASDLPGPADPGGMLELAPGLFLAETAQTRSQLYHAVKRRLRPDRLLVAPLADAPKFKGMAAGALTWLRGRGRAG
ncbi:hypothetical protein QFW77_18860 [Luteimonas sp. RD2P54]|uniref:Uncharacterized protein n=1 Tax=Luteimonas endophytica TaxID=3042023 RepID=A0ABT6JDX5_9GAMM|nr:hypothetical protein [Luteimonas endophytica]MDH5825033.1 hypothetical protein [Luteimonas endophytica]